MPTVNRRCLVLECGKRVISHSPLCDDCYMSLCSGVVKKKKTTSFLRCIPWMREKLIDLKTLALSEQANDSIKVALLIKALEEIESDGE